MNLLKPFEGLIFRVGMNRVIAGKLEPLSPDERKRLEPLMKELAGEAYALYQHYAKDAAKNPDSIYHLYEELEKERGKKSPDQKKIDALDARLKSLSDVSTQRFRDISEKYGETFLPDSAFFEHFACAADVENTVKAYDSIRCITQSVLGARAKAVVDEFQLSPAQEVDLGRRVKQAQDDTGTNLGKIANDSEFNAKLGAAAVLQEIGIPAEGAADPAPQLLKQVVGEELAGKAGRWVKNNTGFIRDNSAMMAQSYLFAGATMDILVAGALAIEDYRNLCREQGCPSPALVAVADEHRSYEAHDGGLSTGRHLTQQPQSPVPIGNNR